MEIYKITNIFQLIFEGDNLSRKLRKLTWKYKNLYWINYLLTFRSFLQTFTVFVLIPFTFIGVVVGHLIHGIAISVLSGFGVIALLGVLVNDGLVFISSFNINIKEGHSFFVALEKTALSRFRPILLTTMTTVFGLLPLIFETSMQAQFLIPMAISLSYGIIIATLLTLILLF